MHTVVRSYFDIRIPVVLIMMTTGVSHRYHSFINGNINSSRYFMATCFGDIIVTLQPNIRSKMYIY